MINEIFADTTDSFDKTLAALDRDFTKIRTGRANLAILEGISVDYYGSQTPVTQVASCNVADPRMITVKPWDKGMLPAIEKAILAADIGITPNSDGIMIRLPIPPLTIERRQKLVKEVKKMGEASKVSLRGHRRDSKDLIESAELPEDDMHRQLKKLQELTDEYVAKIDTKIEAKEKEILED